MTKIKDTKNALSHNENMDLFIELMIGSVMIGITVIIHAIGLDLIIKRVSGIETTVRKRHFRLWQPILSAIVVILIFILHILHIWLWAGLYILLDCLPSHNLTQILFFSTTSYTTVGTSSLELKQGFLMLGGVESMNGVIMLGWTTAFIFEFISQIYQREAKLLKD